MTVLVITKLWYNIYTCASLMILQQSSCILSSLLRFLTKKKSPSIFVYVVLTPSGEHEALFKSKKLVRVAENQLFPKVNQNL